MQLGKIDLPVNVPVSVALASLVGEKVPSSYPPGSQYRFSDENGRPLYLPLDVGDRVRDLGSTCIRLTKAKPAHGGRIEWKVEPITGEQKNGTFVVPKEKPAPMATSPEFATETGLSQSTRGSSLPNNGNVQTVSEPDTARKRFLWNAGRELVDAHAALLKYASEKHVGILTSYDVRTYLITCFIQSQSRQAGGRR